jgi:hypothetical protein
MFLSNSRKYFILAGLLAFILQACSSAATNENKPVEIKIETKKEFPFPVKEPEVYQAELVVASSGTESRWFIARDREKSRLDTFAGNVPILSKIRSDKLFIVDHQKKTYAVLDNDGGSVATGADEIAVSFFRAKEYREFEDLGLEGKLRKFKVKEPFGATGSVLIYIDETSGMMVKQEFLGLQDASGLQAKVTCELRDLKFEVDNAVFSIPGDYRSVTPDAIRKPRP